MLGIFDDDQRASGSIWSNPFGARPIWPLDNVAKGLKWSALRRLSRPASSQMSHANAITMVFNRP